jgi:hypothetical protein
MKHRFSSPGWQGDVDASCLQQAPRDGDPLYPGFRQGHTEAVNKQGYRGAEGLFLDLSSAIVSFDKPPEYLLGIGCGF